MADANKENLDLFLNSGLDKRKAEDTLKNKNLTESLSAVLKEAHKIPSCNVKDVVNHLYLVATTFSPEALGKHRSFIVQYVADKKIHKINFDAAKAYFKTLGADNLDVNHFEKECGVGVVITRDNVKTAVANYIESKKDELVKERYQFPIGTVLGAIRDQLKWADSKDIKEEADAQILALLGPKTKEDEERAKNAKKEPKKEVKKDDKTNNNTEQAVQIKELITFPDPKDNKQKRHEILEAHLKATGGRVICRFPPEPNGYLHLGHAKSMNLNFSYPQKSGGKTYLRFDDTNPEAEKAEYFTSIIDDVYWMGHRPAAINYSSDYFPILYDYAIKLIKEGKAYVCFQSAEQMSDYKEKRMPSPWRDASVEDNLLRFEDMRIGKYKEGEATLRMKMDMSSDNPCMRDLVAYRIKFAPHPHAGDKWCIYPTYDYTHCLIDSLENITHSLCTLEFEVRRESYFWELDALDVYKPIVWEYSRLNVTHTVLSKRKLITLVNSGFVKGWDDPRMPTIRGLRRRGYTPEAINNFCDRIGVTRNENIISINLLEQCCREELDAKANRAMAIVEPLKVTITNWEGPVKEINVHNHPKDANRGSHKVPLSAVIYIEHSDFREVDVKGYKRLAPGISVGLVHADASIHCTDFVKDSTGKITELKATIEWGLKTKPRGFIHWVAEPSPGQEPLTVELRLYDKLFKSEDLATVDKWESDLNPESLVVKTKCFVDPSVKSAHVGTQFQFERVGYFVVDPDTTSEKMVWNRVVSLKESKWED